MRLYTFGNYYLSSIQQGIQAGHAAVEMFVKYDEVKDKLDKVKEWTFYHKTMVCLNGGNNKDLLEIKDILTQNDMYPWSYFCEDQESLNGTLTCIAIVLPEEIYETAAKLRTKEYKLLENSVIDKDDLWYGELSDFEVKLIELLNKCQLAR